MATGLLRHLIAHVNSLPISVLKRKRIRGIDNAIVIDVTYISCFIECTQVEKRKLDEMKLPEKITYTLPPCNATSMKIITRLLNESQETLLETEQLDVKLSLVSNVF